MLNSKSVGNKIAEARKRINFSQAELASQVSISAQAVGKWERGESMPDIATLTRLAEIFGVDLNYFSSNSQYENAETAAYTPQKDVDEPASLKPNKSFNGNWDMSEGNWVDADFSGLKNLQEKFSSSNIKNCKFIGADLAGLFLKSNYIDACDFSGADLRNSRIHTSSLSKSNFTDCSLIDTVFTKSEVKNCDFNKANFSGAEFLDTNFQNNTVEMAVWKHTSFKSTGISDIVFEGVLEDCSFENCTFKNVTFQNVTMKNTFFKHNSKLHRVQFTGCKVDRLTHAFLKSGKANLEGITLLEE